MDQQHLIVVPAWFLAAAGIGLWQVVLWTISATWWAGDALLRLHRRRRRARRVRHADRGDVLAGAGGGLSMRAAGWWPTEDEEDEERH